MTLDLSGTGWHAQSTQGVIAAGTPESVIAGLTMLEAGGNAVDAAVATLFSLMVTDHGQCSIGGEVPMLIYDGAAGKVSALCGQGRAPLSEAAISWYMQHGIPGGDDIKMAPVPSAVDSCITALKRFGTFSLAQVLESTLAVLEQDSRLIGSALIGPGDTGPLDGFDKLTAGGTPVPRAAEAWQSRLAITLRKLLDEENITSGSREEKLQAACDRFYGRHPERNDIAEALEAGYIERGGFLRIEDLAAHGTGLEDPVSADYRGYTICKCGPWTQGPMLCQALRLLEGFDISSMGHYSADHIHVSTEALKLAMADRDAHYADTDFVDVPLDALLSDAYTELRRPLIDMSAASAEVRPGDPIGMQALGTADTGPPSQGGTTTCLTADRWGNVVSATPSANVPEGAEDIGGTGVTYSNRLLSFNTNPDHPNCIKPGKRPRSTLTPTLVLKDGKPVMAISVAGGDYQDQVTLNLLLDVIDFRMRPDKAVRAPRFATTHHEDSFNPNPERERTVLKRQSLDVYNSIDPNVSRELSGRGHQIARWKEPIGHPVMLMLEDGVMFAAGDPDAEMHAAGLD